MSDLFDSLKESITKAKDPLIDIHQQRKINRILVITDSYDDLNERFKRSDQLADRLNANRKRIYLYDPKSNLVVDDENYENSLVEILKAHSSIIRELKDKNVSILLEESVKNFLFSFRELRKKATEDEIAVDEASALADFFIGDLNRQVNLALQILEIVRDYKPQLVYFKPALLSNREKINIGGFNTITKKILKEKPKGTWVYLRADSEFTKSKNASILILAGQSVSSLLGVAHAANTLYPNINKIELTYVVLIDKNKENVASLISELQDAENIRDILAKKYVEQVEKIRIQEHLPNIKVVFGSIQSELEIVLRELETEIMFVSPDMDTERAYDEEALNAAEIAVKQGISVILTY